MKLIEDGLYHADLGIPWGLMNEYLIGAFQLDYGPHARRAAITDRFGKLFSVPLSLMLVSDDVFEVEVEQGSVVKFCVRLKAGFAATPHAGSHPLDLVLVCMPSTRRSHTLFVKTLWLNDRTDDHATLDKSKYNTL